MTASEFQRLVDRSAPSDWLNLEWSQYDTEAYAAAFLPKVNQRFPDERLRLVDAGALFASSITRELGRAAPAQGPEELFTMTVHTMPDGVPAVLNKQKATVAADELLMRCIVRPDDTVSVDFELGRNVREGLRQLKQGQPIPERLAMNSTVAELGAHFRVGFDRLAVTRLLAGTLGLAKDLEEELRADPEPPAAPFSAGSYGSKGKKGWAHGDIEEEALASVGYSSPERRQVYYGNWLRDFSQIIVGVTLGFDQQDSQTLKELSEAYPNLSDTFSTEGLQYKLTHAQWIELLSIMAVHEFAFKPRRSHDSQERSYLEYKAQFESEFGTLDTGQLGVYRPEEHLDNPKGLANESIYGDKDVVHKVEYRHGLPSDTVNPMRTLYAGLPEGDERNAQGTGALDIDGSENMKNFLIHDTHGIQDSVRNPGAPRPSPMTYFADQMRLAAQKGRNKDGLRHFGAAMHVLEDFYAHSNFVELALIKNGFHRVWPWVELSPEVEEMTDGPAKAASIPLTTGYFSTPDTLASIAPKVAEVFFEPKDNPLTSKDNMPYVPPKPGHRTFADVMILSYLKAHAINQGALNDDEKETFAGLTYADLYHIYFQVLLARDGWAEQLNKPGLWGRFLRRIDRSMKDLGNAIAFFPKLVITLLLESTTSMIGTLQTYVDPNFGDDPSHTQLAKDPPEHHLNSLAGELAVEAVRDVGERMAACWKGASVEGVIQRAHTTYFKHPMHIDWMDERVKEWAKRHKNEVERATSKTPVEHHEKELEVFIEETLPAVVEYYKGVLGLGRKPQPAAPELQPTVPQVQ